MSTFRKAIHEPGGMVRIRWYGIWMMPCMHHHFCWSDLYQRCVKCKPIREGEKPPEPAP